MDAIAYCYGYPLIYRGESACLPLLEEEQDVYRRKIF